MPFVGFGACVLGRRHGGDRFGRSGSRLHQSAGGRCCSALQALPELLPVTARAALAALNLIRGPCDSRDECVGVFVALAVVRGAPLRRCRMRSVALRRAWWPGLSFGARLVRTCVVTSGDPLRRRIRLLVAAGRLVAAPAASASSTASASVVALAVVRLAFAGLGGHCGVIARAINSAARRGRSIGRTAFCAGFRRAAFRMGTLWPTFARGVVGCVHSTVIGKRVGGGVAARPFATTTTAAAWPFFAGCGRAAGARRSLGCAVRIDFGLAATALRGGPLARRGGRRKVG